MSEEYYNSKSSVDEYIKIAEGFSGEELIKKLKHFLPQNSTLLELGTGPGTDWKILSAGYQVTGSDFSYEFLKRLVKKYPEGEFLELNATTIATDKLFDGIYSNKVLHHLNDEELDRSIKRQWEVLNSDGIICHSFWKGEGTEVFNGMFVNNHLQGEIKDRFGALFEVSLIETYAEFDRDDSILLIGQKKS